MKLMNLKSIYFICFHLSMQLRLRLETGSGSEEKIGELLDDG